MVGCSGTAHYHSYPCLVLYEEMQLLSYYEVNDYDTLYCVGINFHRVQFLWDILYTEFYKCYSN